MPSLTSAQAAALARRRQRNGRPRPRSQIIKMQASMLSGATDASIPLHIRAAAARAWDVLEERLRIIAGKPLPGHLKPERVKSSQRTRKAMLSIAQSDLPSTPAG
jgi:hypothetical protein